MDYRDNQIVIGFDLDGVIIDQAHQKVRIGKKIGLDLKLEDTAFGILESKYSSEVVEQIKSILYNDPMYALRATLMEGVINVFDFLKEKQYPFFLISRRRHPDMAVKLLERLEIWPFIINDVNSYFVSGPEAKNIKAKELGITHYIDDELKIIHALDSVKNKYLFDRFNVFAEHTAYKKIKSWYDFEKLINGI